MPPTRTPQEVALCLSGGGYRAAAFHLGALRRLAETGWLERVTLVSSVSGGSIVAAHLAQRMVDLGRDCLRFDDFERDVAEPLRAQVLRHDIRTVPFLAQWALPWNWFRLGVAADALVRQYERHLVELTLRQLPKTPRFVFCSTNLFNGKSWTFHRKGAGDYETGRFGSLADLPVAVAVAASSCFPPLFLPLQLRRRASTRTKQPLEDYHLTDGGLYDNLGLQPALSAAADVLLVSDGSGTFDRTVSRWPHRRIARYPEIATRQVHALRWKELMAILDLEGQQGATWRIANSSRARAPWEYSAEDVERLLARVRTDLDGFTDPELAVLENHGYAQATARVEAKLESSRDDAPAPTLPHRNWGPLHDVQGACRNSHVRPKLDALLGLLRAPTQPFRSRR